MAALVSVGLVVAACGGTTGSPFPSASLIPLDFTPLPSSGSSSPASTRTPGRSAVVGSWPIGWDVAFCTAFADLTVAHQLVIDIQRAIDEDARDDAAGLAADLAETVPIARTELERTADWSPAAAAKEQLLAMLDLDAQVATAYRTYFDGNVRSALRDARQARNQVGKAVAAVNAELQTLTDAGLACPGTDLQLEKF